MPSTIPLHELRVVNKQHKLEANIQSSFCVDLPQGFKRIGNLDQLTQAIRERQLWIARIGPCYLELSIHIDNVPILDNALLEPLARHFQRCEVSRIK